METINRQEAIDRGLTRFFTGKPCKKGHVAERYTLQGQCCECQKLYLREYNGDVKKRIQAARLRSSIGRGGE